MKLYKTLLAITFTTFVFAQTPKQLEHLDAYFQKSLDEWQVPGMAIAITTRDSIIFSKGYGYANIEKKQKVDGNTLFAVASNSKAFTASSLAKLIEEGKLKWNDKVVDFLPYYKMYNDYVTNNTTIEDLLCHRNGLITFSGDLLWYGTTKTAEEIIAAQQYLEPKYDFRSTYGYSNISYLAAGKVIEKLSGKTWQNYISENFLKPLKMSRTLTSTSQLKSAKNIATPYYFENGKNNVVQWVNWDNIAPAGGLISSVNDFAKWLQLNLKKGKIDENSAVFSENSFVKMTTPHINHQVQQNSERINFRGYGLGWSIQDYQGYKVIGHGGGYDGMISKSFFIPEKEIGVVILTNSINWLPSAIGNKIMDVILTNNLNGKDWASNYLEYKKQQDEASAKAYMKIEDERGNLNPNHLNFSEYTGVYKDKMYGTVTVSIKQEKLHFTMDKTPIFYADLEHWNHHIFTFDFPKELSSLPEGKLWFDLDKNGKVSALHIDVPNPDFYFTEFEFIKQK